MFTESEEFTLLKVNSWLLFTWCHPLCCREAVLQCPYHSKLKPRPSTPQVRSRVPMQCYNPAGGRESTSRREQAPCSWSPWTSRQREAGTHHAWVQHRCFDSLYISPWKEGGGHRHLHVLTTTSVSTKFSFFYNKEWIKISKAVLPMKLWPGAWLAMALVNKLLVCWRSSYCHSKSAED